MMKLDSVVTIVPTVVTAELDGSVTIFHPTTDRYYTLEGVGAAIWQLLEQTSSLEQVRNAIVARYETTEETCERDIMALVAQCQAAGLLEVRPRGESAAV
jgi:hypothetical protein